MFKVSGNQISTQDKEEKEISNESNTLCDEPMKNNENNNNNCTSTQNNLFKTTIEDKNTANYENISYSNGRWNKEEHKRFVLAIAKKGNNWLNVQQAVQTRSSTQIRSHAQKFFEKIFKMKTLDLGQNFSRNSLTKLQKKMEEMSPEEYQNTLNTLTNIAFLKVTKCGECEEEEELDENGKQLDNNNIYYQTSVNSKIGIKRDKLTINQNNQTGKFLGKKTKRIKNGQNNIPAFKGGVIHYPQTYLNSNNNFNYNNFIYNNINFNNSSISKHISNKNLLKKSINNKNNLTNFNKQININQNQNINQAGIHTEENENIQNEDTSSLQEEQNKLGVAKNENNNYNNGIFSFKRNRKDTEKSVPDYNDYLLNQQLNHIYNNPNFFNDFLHNIRPSIDSTLGLRKDSDFLNSRRLSFNLRDRLKSTNSLSEQCLLQNVPLLALHGVPNMFINNTNLQQNQITNQHSAFNVFNIPQNEDKYEDFMGYNRMFNNVVDSKISSRRVSIDDSNVVINNLGNKLVGNNNNNNNSNNNQSNNNSN